MKDTQSEIKQNIQGTNSDRKETRTQSNDLKQKGKINIQLEQNEEIRIKKSEERQRQDGGEIGWSGVHFPSTTVETPS